MRSLVLELQEEALSRATTATELLRKAYAVAQKLNVMELEIWLKREMNGYGNIPRSEIPDYRTVHGTPKVYNPYRGWQDLNFANPDSAIEVSKMPMAQSVAEIEHMLTGAAIGGVFMAPYAPDITNELMKVMTIPLQPSLHIPPSSMSHIINVVRNTILDWALKLEKDKILGNGMSFSKEEITNATNAKYTLNFINGDIHNSVIQQGTKESNQSGKS